MILVVDDDQRIVKLLRHVLELKGYTVETAANGGEAYGLVKSPDCKCMVLDINMPAINGIELLLLMQTEGISVPTIVMAGFDGYNEDEMKEFANVVRFLPKPFEMDDLLDAVEEHTLR